MENKFQTAIDNWWNLKKSVGADQYQYRRKSAGRKGTLRDFTPKQAGYYSYPLERSLIVERSIELTNSDPNAAGIVQTIPETVIGSGLNPHPALDFEALGITKETSRIIQKKQKNIYQQWILTADAGNRMSFGEMQLLMFRCLLQFGEFIALIHMIETPLKPYGLNIRIIHPMRLKTPSDLLKREDIREGVEIGSYGEPVAYWIQRSATIHTRTDSKTFDRIPVRTGHRQNIIHGYLNEDPEQYRGLPIFSPSVKWFKDLADYLDAELVSNVATAAFALFIETGEGENPLFPAQNMATITDTGYKSDGSSYDERYQEIQPGAIMYGAQGEKPHTISAQRPGATFKMFMTQILKSISQSVWGLPYPVLFKDFEGMNYASYRSAMLEAWRVYQNKRVTFGCWLQPVWNMLIEEAWLRGDLPEITDFYGMMSDWTRVEWLGKPKGQIEPIKEVQADVLAIQNNLKSRTQVITEQGGDIETVFAEIDEEQEKMKELGLHEEKMHPEGNQMQEDTDDD
jgi:lambda family phage portal protein